MKKLYFIASTLIAISVLIYSCDKKVGMPPQPDPAAPPPPVGSACDSVKYSVEIASIIDNNCVSCHNNSLQQGGVNFVGYTNAKAKALDGRIKARAIDGIPGLPMPQGGLLPQAQRDLLQCWVNNGALQ